MSKRTTYELYSAWRNNSAHLSQFFTLDIRMNLKGIFVAETINESFMIRHDELLIQ